MWTGFSQVSNKYILKAEAYLFQEREKLLSKERMIPPQKNQYLLKEEDPPLLPTILNVEEVWGEEIDGNGSSNTHH